MSANLTLTACDDLDGEMFGDQARTGSVTTAWDKGFNFRATSGFVTDGANETYVIETTYPVTRNAVTFGYASGTSINTRDRDSGNDRRLAGLHYSSTETDYFRVDLQAAGTYDVYIAGGDASNPQTEGFFIGDGSATPIWTVADTATSANQFIDANGTVFSNVTWPTSNVAKRLTFSTTEFRLYLAPANAIRPMAHLRLVRVS